MFINVNGEILKVVSCETCEIAWLYQDAKNNGIELYKSVLGRNVICPESNVPVLENNNEIFIDLMESCPEV